jgi:hypothetical protein
LSRFTPDAVSSFRTHLLDTGRKLTLLLGGNPGRLSSPAISN